MKNFLIKLNWILSTQFGLDLRKLFHAIYGIPRYIYDLACFRRNFNGRLKIMPCLHDWYEEGGSTKSEYFWQDLLIARMIFEAKPEKHVDIGSRVDGFVAHVASFREIEVFDVRPITTKIPSVIFKQVDFMKPIEEISGYCDSLSCLHAFEHFGLGRYGDKVDPNGCERGFFNMAKLVKVSGVFYLSVPIGVDRVEFNANRVFDPRFIIAMANKNSLRLIEFLVIQHGGKITNVPLDVLGLSDWAMQRYALGIFTFIKCTE